MVEREVPHSHTLNTAEGVGGAPSLAAKLPTVVRSDTVIGKVRRFDPFIMRLLAARCSNNALRSAQPDNAQTRQHGWMLYYRRSTRSSWTDGASAPDAK